MVYGWLGLSRFGCSTGACRLLLPGRTSLDWYYRCWYAGPNRDTGHLLLALLEEQDELVLQVLEALGADPDQIEQEVRGRLAQRLQPS